MFAAAFVFQTDIANGDVVAECFAHVVEGERRNAGGGQRFHFNSGFVGDAAGGMDVEGARSVVVGDIKFDFIEWQWVTERDEAGGLFGGHDARQLCGRDNGAFFGLAAACAQGSVNVWREGNAGAGGRAAASRDFVTDVHHVCVAVGGQVGE